MSRDDELMISLLAVSIAYREYVDALPKGLELPAMPGHDRDWSDSVIEVAERRFPKWTSPPQPSTTTSQ